MTHVAGLIIRGVLLAAVTTQPADPRQRIRDLFLGLSDADPAVRESSREQLMVLPAAQLPALRAVAGNLKPIEPAVARDLREIVRHLFLRGEPYDAGNEGFLGIQLADTDAPDAPDGRDTAIVVTDRMCGFCGYAVLAIGDIILDIEERPLARNGMSDEFGLAIRVLGAGKTVHLKVLRRGKIVRVAVTLDGRPLAPDAVRGFADFMDGFNAERYRRADEHWTKQFAPFLAEP